MAPRRRKAAAVVPAVPVTPARSESIVPAETPQIAQSEPSSQVDTDSEWGAYAWDANEERTAFFLELLTNGKKRGLRARNGWKDQMIVEVCQAFTDSSFPSLSKVQFKSRYDALRKAWVEVNWLLSKSGQPFELNSETMLIEGSDQAWEDAIQANKAVARWRWKRMPWLDSLHDIFFGNIATGKYAQKSNQNIDPRLLVETNDFLDDESVRSQTPTPTEKTPSMRLNMSAISDLAVVLKDRIVERSQSDRPVKQHISDRRMAIRLVLDVCCGDSWPMARKAQALSLTESDNNVDLILELSDEDRKAWIELTVPNLQGI